MEQESTPSPRTRERTSFFNSVYADITGALLTIGSGLVAAAIVINKNFFRNSEKDGLLLDLSVARDEARRKVRKNSGDEWVAEIKKIENEYEHSKNTLLKERGLAGSWKKFKSLRDHQKTEVGLTLAAVSAVALGAVSAFFGSRDTGDKLDAIQRRLDAQDNRPSL